METIICYQNRKTMEIYREIEKLRGLDGDFTLQHLVHGNVIGVSKKELNEEYEQISGRPQAEYIQEAIAEQLNGEIFKEFEQQMKSISLDMCLNHPNEAKKMLQDIKDKAKMEFEGDLGNKQLIEIMKLAIDWAATSEFFLVL